MTTIAEIDRQIAELIDRRIDALQAQKAEMEKQWPQKGDGYFTPWSKGDEVVWYEDEDDSNNLAAGDVFRTREAATHRRKQMIVTQKLRDIRGDWKPDWINEKCEKFYLYYGHSSKRWFIENSLFCQVQGTIYFPTKETAERALALGDELNCLLEDV